MELFKKLVTTPVPRSLFLCRKCQMYPDYVEAHVQAGELKIHLACHGEELDLAYPAKVEMTTPIEIFLGDV